MAFVVLSELRLDALRLLYTFSPLLAYSVLLLLGQGFSWRKKLGKHYPPLSYLFFFHFPEKSPSFGRLKRKYLVVEERSLLLYLLRFRYLLRSGSVLHLLFSSTLPFGFLIYREKFIPITHLSSNSKISFQIYIHR